MNTPSRVITLEEQNRYCGELSSQCFVRVPGLDVDGHRAYDFGEHQQQGMESLAVNLHLGCKRTSIVHPCGSGKSVLEAGIIQASQAAKALLNGTFRNSQDIVLSVERTIIGGIREHIEDLGLDVGQWGSGYRQLDRPVVVATIQALQNSTNLAAQLNLNNTTLIIGDEADVLSTSARSKLLDRFPIAQRVGLTATDKRNDGRLIQGPWGEIAHRVTLREGIESGIATPPLYYLFEAAVEGDQIKLHKGDYDSTALEQAMKRIEIEKAIPEVYESLIPKEKRKDFPTLVYVPSVKMLHQVTHNLRERYRGEGLSISSWHGDVSGKQVSDEISDFERGAIDILVLCEMGGRGLNLVRARCIIDGHPTLSLPRVEQRHSRAFRVVRGNSRLAAEGFEKPFALVAQIVPQSNKRRPATLLDVLDAWDEYKVDSLLDFGTTGLNTTPAERRHTAEEVDMIVQHVGGNRVVLPNLSLLRKVDYLQTIKMRDDLPKINSEGYAFIDGERYASAPKWAEVIGIGQITIRKKIDVSLGKHAVNESNTDFDVYPESYIREVFKVELATPKVDKDGYIYVENRVTGEVEPHASAATWGSILGLSTPAVTYFMKPVRQKYAVDGREARNILRKKGFYPKSAIEKYCAPAVKALEGVEDRDGLPKIEEDGFARVDMERVAPAGKWALEFGISKKTVEEEVKKHEKELSATKILGNNGRVYVGYKEAAMRKLMHFILKYPRAGSDNFIVPEGSKERHATATRWSRELGLGLTIVQERLANSSQFAISGRERNGEIHENAFYPETVVRKECGDLLKMLEELNDDVPSFDKEGFFVLGGKKYGTVGAISKKIGIATVTIESKLAKSGAKVIQRKRKRNARKHSRFYSLDDARAVCTDLLKGDYYEVGRDGFFEALNPHTKKEERHATLSRWQTLDDVPFTAATLRKRLKKNGNLEKGITGYGYKRRIEEGGFYPESFIREVCKESEYPEAESDGFYYDSGGTRYSSIYRWMKILKLTNNKVKTKLLLGYAEEHEGIFVIPLNQEEPVEFYSEDGIAELVEEHLFQADEKGFFKLEDVTVGLFRAEGDSYGTLDAWAAKIDSYLDAGVVKIRKELSKTMVGNKCIAIPGKNSSGEVLANAFFAQRDIVAAYPELGKLFDAEDTSFYTSESGLTDHQREVYGHYLDPETEAVTEREVTSAMERLHLLLQHKDVLARRIDPHSKEHPALAGDTVYVIPLEYEDIYKLISKNTGLKRGDDHVFAFTENRGLVKLLASELIPVDEGDDDWGDDY